MNEMDSKSYILNEMFGEELPGNLSVTRVACALGFAKSLLETIFVPSAPTTFENDPSFLAPRTGIQFIRSGPSTGCLNCRIFDLLQLCARLRRTVSLFVHLRIYGRFSTVFGPVQGRGLGSDRRVLDLSFVLLASFDLLLTRRRRGLGQQNILHFASKALSRRLHRRTLCCDESDRG